jgi:NAD(P)-dependent dehydrogenase (short-subunit alcohol dehydrogenase family)
MEFADKVALITGGTSGMGLAAARRLLADGASVVVTGRNEARLSAAAEDLGDGVLAVRADVARVPELGELMRRIERRHGRLDIVFANAGVGVFKRVDELTEDDIDHVLDINVKGVFHTVRAALPLLAGGGSIVINASWTLHRGLAVGSLYSASKAAVHNLARTLATDLADRGIRVNSISPGFIRTEMFEEAAGGPEGEEQARRDTVLGRIGSPEEVAEAVAFLASDRAAYITGQDLVIDGGLLGAIPVPQ